MKVLWKFHGIYMRWLQKFHKIFNFLSYQIPLSRVTGFKLKWQPNKSYSPWISRKSSAKTGGPLSIELPEPLNILPVVKRMKFQRGSEVNCMLMIIQAFNLELRHTVQWNHGSTVWQFCLWGWCFNIQTIRT